MKLSEHLEAWSTLVSNWPAAPRYAGVTCQQHPSDLDRYAEVIAELRPKWLLQTGIYWGGTAAFLADRMHEADSRSRCLFVDTLLWNCQVRADDLPNTTIVQESATSESFCEFFSEWTAGERGLISIDDLHTAEQVRTELAFYPEYAEYLVVEDTILDAAEGTIWQPTNPGQALREWLPCHPEFVPDPDPEPTQHVGGWLRRTFL